MKKAGASRGAPAFCFGGKNKRVQSLCASEMAITIPRKHVFSALYIVCAEISGP